MSQAFCMCLAYKYFAWYMVQHDPVLRCFWKPMKYVIPAAHSIIGVSGHLWCIMTKFSMEWLQFACTVHTSFLYIANCALAEQQVLQQSMSLTVYNIQSNNCLSKYKQIANYLGTHLHMRGQSPKINWAPSTPCQIDLTPILCTVHMHINYILQLPYCCEMLLHKKLFCYTNTFNNPILRSYLSSMVTIFVIISQMVQQELPFHLPLLFIPRWPYTPVKMVACWFNPGCYGSVLGNLGVVSQFFLQTCDGKTKYNIYNIYVVYIYTIIHAYYIYMHIIGILYILYIYIYMLYVYIYKYIYIYI